MGSFGFLQEDFSAPPSSPAPCEHRGDGDSRESPRWQCHPPAPWGVGLAQIQCWEGLGPAPVGGFLLGAAKGRAECASREILGLWLWHKPGVLEVWGFQEGLVKGAGRGTRWSPRAGESEMAGEFPVAESTGGNWDPPWREEEGEEGLEGATILFPGAAGWSWRRRIIWTRRG